MKARQFYIHLQSDNLAHYLVKGVFCPTLFLSNRNKDIQDINNTYILFSEIKWNKQYDCSIEITITENELSRLQEISKNYYISPDCFPISRLKQIYFSDKQRAETVIWNINNGAAFVPKWAVVFEQKSKKETAELNSNKIIEDNKEIKDIKELLKRYDRLMGGLSFIKVALLRSYFKGLDITLKHLTTLTNFNTYVENQLANQGISLDRGILNVFSPNSAIYRYLTKDITYEEVDNVGKKERQVVQKKFNAIQFDNINQNSLTYKLAMLHTYGKGKVKSEKDLVSGLLSNVNIEAAEELALIYGLYNGYENLRNSYIMNNDEVAIKFDLSDSLQLYTVESLFNFVFNNHKKSDEIEFLNNNSFNPNNNQKKENYKYFKFLNKEYAFEKERKKDEDTLSATLLKTIKDWFKKYNKNIDDQALSDKLELIIIPEIKNTIINVDLGKALEKTNLEVVNNELLKKEAANKSNKEEKQPIKNPDLFSSSETIEDNKSAHNTLNIQELQKKSVSELKDFCKEKKYKGYSKYNKADLLKLILSKQD